MDLEIRPIRPDEFLAYGRAIMAAFGETSSDEEIESERALIEFDRTLAVFDDGRIVATAGAISFELTLPGLTTLPVAGVTAVAVLPTHRRRGLLRQIMRRQLGDIRAGGEAVAILNASESSIYGRFGYGVATELLRIEVDRAHAAFAQPAEPTGRLTLLDRARAAEVLPEVYDRARRRQPGALTRSRAWWEHYLLDPEQWRDGASARFYVTYEPVPGRVEGYISYRVESKWENGLSNRILRLMEMVTISDEAYRALWHYCFNVDLVAAVQASWAPVDEPLRWMLADPRRARVTALRDFLWVRLVDLPTALAARRYGVTDRLVIEVQDPFCPQNSGRYELEGGPDGARCRPTGTEADLAVDVADLGAAYLGGVRFSTLARAGRVVEQRVGALARADALFAGERAPFCSTDF